MKALDPAAAEDKMGRPKTITQLEHRRVLAQGVVETVVRHANNALVDVLAQHGRYLDPQVYAALRKAASAVTEAMVARPKLAQREEE